MNETNTMKSIPTKYLILAGIITVAIVLRLYHFTANPLWIDEGWTLYVASHGWLELPFLDVHPPVHYWLIKAVISVFEPTEAIIRAPALLFGVVAVILTYFFGREFTGHDWPGLIAAGIMAVSPDQVFHSQDARSYTIWLSIWIVFMIFYLKSIDSHDSRKNWIITGALAGACMWVHYWSVFPLVALGVYALWRERKHVTPVLYSLLVFVGLVIPLIPIALRGLSIKSVEGWTIFHPWTVILQNTWMAFAGGDVIIAILMGVFTIIGLYVLVDNRAHIRHFEVAVVLFVVTVVTFLLMSPWFMVIPKYGMYLAPVVYALVGLGVCSSTIQYTDHKKWLGVVLIALVMLICATPLSTYYDETNRGRWYDHNAELTAITGGEPVAVLANPGLATQWAYYYSGQTAVFYDSYMLDGLISGEYRAKYIFVPTADIPDSEPEARIIYDYLRDNGTYISVYRGFETWRVN